MKDFKLTPMNLETDKPIISAWSEKYKGLPEYEAIERYILEDDLMRSLGAVIEANYEVYHIGEDEKKIALVAKSTSDEILGFMIFNAFDLTTKNSQLFLQYIVVSSEYQHQGYGAAMFDELIINAKTYIGVMPKEIFSYIDKSNYASISMFLKKGCSLEPVGGGISNGFDFLKAIGNVKNLQQQIENKSLSWGIYE